MKILTFDIEEWFHLLDNESTKTVYQWDKFECRIHNNMEKIFSILEKHNQKATFFCLGWIAEKYPEVIKKIVDLGYEIGSHSYMHQLVYEQNPSQFSEDLNRSVDILENISGQKVKYFRAPGFSITESNKWAFDVLLKNGIEVDCSIFPTRRSHGGYSSFQSSGPSILNYNGSQLIEFPINTISLLNKHLVFSGGGYFRLLPYIFIKNWTKKSNYVMSYFHPRDFDPGQKMIKDLSLPRKFKSYVGLKGTQNKLEKWLSDFKFTDIKTSLEQINWDLIKVIDI